MPWFVTELELRGAPLASLACMGMNEGSHSVGLWPQPSANVDKSEAEAWPHYIIQAAALVGETSGMPKYDEAWRAIVKWPW